MGNSYYLACFQTCDRINFFRFDVINQSLEISNYNIENPNKRKLIEKLKIEKNFEMEYDEKGIFFQIDGNRYKMLISDKKALKI